MPKPHRSSPARSQGAVTTPRRQKSRGSRSLCSAALSTASGRLTSIIDQFKDKNMESFALSPLNGRSVLNDNTDIEEPRRKSWWKKLDENSQDVMEVLEDNKVTDANNMIEEFIDIEVLSQEKKNYTLDLPESSDNESINSIVLPQRRLFTQKENQPQKTFNNLVGNRETLAKLHKTTTTNIDKTINVGTRELFQKTKRSKPVFPAALLNISPNKTTADKTKENIVPEPKQPVRNIFGNRPASKRKNIFVDFIVSESEDEIPDIQPKVFGFQKKPEQRRISTVSKGRDASPTSSITTDMEMDEWKLLPSSTMVENQLEDMVTGNTPIKRARLSKLSEAKESEAGTNTIQTITTIDKTKQSNKSASSKNKSKSSPEVKESTLDNSRITRSITKNMSKREDTSRKQDITTGNKSQSKIVAKNNDLDVSPSKPEETDKQNTTLNNKQNKSRTRNSSKVIDKEIVLVNVAVNDETKVINKSTTKTLSNSVVNNQSRNELNMKVDDHKSTVIKTKAQDKLNQTASEINEQNDQTEDENNFTLEYENDDNEMVEEAAVHDDQRSENIKHQHTTVLKKVKGKQETATNESKSNKSLQKSGKTVEEYIESQPNERLSADDNVDGNLEHGIEREADQIEYEEKLSQEIAKEENESHGNEEEGSESEEIENKTNESDDNEEEANENEGSDDEVNISHENDDSHNESREEEEAKLSQVENEENEDEANESDENEHDNNESQEVEAEVNESLEIEQEANASHEVDNDDVPEEENSEEINDDEEETRESINEKEVNKTQEDEDVANESQVVENVSQENGNEDSYEHESEADGNESIASEKIDDYQQTNDSDEADKAIASDAEMSDQDDNQDEMEVDDENEDTDNDESEENRDESQENQNKNQTSVEPSAEEIEESPNVTHDTTGRNRKKEPPRESPELIRNNKTNQMDSFAVHDRNTSVRKTKSMIMNPNIKPSLAPPRDSTGFSDGTRNSSAEGSGWDSHRTTRKTLRQTFGKDFTPRKSLRALVMEKSAKRQTEHIDMHSETVKFPQANSTEFPEDSNRDVEDIPQSDHEISRNTRQTTLEMYLQKMKQQNIEKKLKREEAIRNSLKAPARETLSLFKVPNKPAPHRPKPAQSKPRKQLTSIIPLELPSEVIEDMKYKPPKRFQPTNASWITKRLYKYLENKLEPKYDYKARVRAEKLVETIYHFAKDLRRHAVAPAHAVEVLKHELARLEVVNTHFEFYEFFHEFMPREIRVKVVPDIVNKIPLPRHGVFSDILRGNTVQG